MGLGLISPSTFMAINSYFSSRRGRAVGISLAGAGIGQVFIPHLVRLYLDHYGFQAAVLSMSFLSFTGVCYFKRKFQIISKNNEFLIL